MWTPSSTWSSGAWSRSGSRSPGSSGPSSTASLAERSSGWSMVQRSRLRSSTSWSAATSMATSTSSSGRSAACRPASPSGRRGSPVHSPMRSAVVVEHRASPRRRRRGPARPSSRPAAGRSPETDRVGRSWCRRRQLVGLRLAVGGSETSARSPSLPTTSTSMISPVGRRTCTNCPLAPAERVGRRDAPAVVADRCDERQDWSADRRQRGRGGPEGRQRGVGGGRRTGAPRRHAEGQHADEEQSERRRGEDQHAAAGRRRLVRGWAELRGVPPRALVGRQRSWVHVAGA